jgi:CcmD family protein
MENLSYVFWAYMVIWAVIGIYILSLGLRIRRLERRSGQHDTGNDN